MSGQDEVSRAWATSQERLPDGWTLEGLRCASADLSVESRSDDWVAVAIGPNDEQRSHQAADAVSALEDLTESFDRVSR